MSGDRKRKEDNRREIVGEKAMTARHGRSPCDDVGGFGTAWNMTEYKPIARVCVKMDRAGFCLGGHSALCI